MTTIKDVADLLGIEPRTLRKHRNSGYALVENEGGGIDLEKSVQEFVKYQSEIIRKMRAAKGRDPGGSSRNSNQGKNTEKSKEPVTFDEWKTEREKQAAIKLRLANEKDLGELVPFEAILELYNKPLSVVKTKLLDLFNQLSKRLALDYAQARVVDDLVRLALARLDEKGMDELQPVIEEIIERHSKYYSAADEDASDPLGEHT